MQEDLLGRLVTAEVEVRHNGKVKHASNSKLTSWDNGGLVHRMCPIC